ncbi:MAG: radical SAM protein [Desulfobulbus sp.]|nr:radical SAM protein [Desulfobulbus sp.]
MSRNQVEFKKIYVEITNRCNLGCSFCARSDRPLLDMELNAFAEVLKRLQGHTHDLSLHVLGEPLFHPQIASLLALCHASGMRVNLTTNGTLLNGHRQLLLTAPALHQLNISLHSLNELRADTTRRHLKEIIALVREAIRSTALYISLRFWDMDARTSSRDSGKHHWLLDELVTAFTDAAVDISSGLHGRGVLLADRVFLNPEPQFAWPRLSSPEADKYGSCRALRDHLAILVDGTVVACCLDADGHLALGNIFHQSLVEILAGPRARRMREGFAHQWLVEPLCRRCSYRRRFVRRIPDRSASACSEEGVCGESESCTPAKDVCVQQKNPSASAGN